MKRVYIAGLIVAVLLIICLTALVVLVVAQIRLKNDEKIIKEKIEYLLGQAQEIINPVAGNWQENDLGWIFIPDDGEPWSYWADHHDTRKFFTFLDLSLYLGRADQISIQAFQYRKGYASIPVPLDQPGLVRINSHPIQIPAGEIWIERKTPGMLRLMGETKAHLLLDTTIIWAEISIPDLKTLYDEKYSDGGFYWKPEVKAQISDVRETSTVR